MNNIDEVIRALEELSLEELEELSANVTAELSFRVRCERATDITAPGECFI